MLFHLHLLDKKKDIVHVLDIEPTNTVLGHTWSKLMKQTIIDDVKIIEKERIYYLNDEWGPEQTSIKINECIDIINSYDKNVRLDKKAHANMTNEELNFFHEFVVDLQGNDGERPEWYTQAPKQIKKAISDANVLVHRFEDFLLQINKNNKKDDKSYRISVSFDGGWGEKESNNIRLIREMTIDEKKCFSPGAKRGNVYLKYPHKGKSIYEMFKSKDHDIMEEQIIPHNKICSDFKIVLYKDTSNYHLVNFYSWLNENKNLFLSKGIDINDPNITIGNGHVGKVLHDDYISLIDEIYGVSEILKVTFTE